MEALTAEGTRPGEHETWQELANHSLDHDDADPARWRKVEPLPAGSPRVI